MTARMRTIEQADAEVTAAQALVSYGNDLIRTACSLLNTGLSTSYTASTYFNRYAAATILGGKLNPPAAPRPPAAGARPSSSSAVQWTRRRLLDEELAAVQRLARALETQRNEAIAAHKAKYATTTATPPPPTAAPSGEGSSPLPPSSPSFTPEEEKAAFEAMMKGLKEQQIAMVKAELYAIKRPLLDFNRHLQRMGTAYQSNHAAAGGHAVTGGSGGGPHLKAPPGSSSNSATTTRVNIGGIFGGVLPPASASTTLLAPSTITGGASSTGGPFADLLSTAAADDAAAALTRFPPALRGRPLPLLWSSLLASDGGSGGDGDYAASTVCTLWDIVREIAERHASSKPVRADIDVLPVAAACVLLAAKSTFWRLSEGNNITMCIAATFERIDRRRKGGKSREMGSSHGNITIMKDAMVAYERDILDVIGFETACELPHKYALNAIALLSSAASGGTTATSVAPAATTVAPQATSFTPTPATVGATHRPTASGATRPDALSPMALLTKDVMGICNDAALSVAFTRRPTARQAAIVACAAIHVAAYQHQHERAASAATRGMRGAPLVAAVGSIPSAAFQLPATAATLLASSNSNALLPAGWHVLMDVSDAELGEALGELRRLYAACDVMATRTLSRPSVASGGPRHAPPQHQLQAGEEPDTNGGSATYCALVTGEMNYYEGEVMQTIAKVLSNAEDELFNAKLKEEKRRAEAASRALLQQLGVAGGTATPAAGAISIMGVSGGAATSSSILGNPSRTGPSSTASRGLIGGGGGGGVSDAVAAILEGAEDIFSSKKKDKKEKKDKKDKSKSKDSLSPPPKEGSLLSPPPTVPAAANPPSRSVSPAVSSTRSSSAAVHRERSERKRDRSSSRRGDRSGKRHRERSSSRDRRRDRRDKDRGGDREGRSHRDRSRERRRRSSSRDRRRDRY